MINRQCPECGGYEMDNGVDDICDCTELLLCENCGKEIKGFDPKNFEDQEVFCSLECNEEYDGEYDGE